MFVRTLPAVLAVLFVAPLGANAWQERAARETSDLQQLQGTWQLTSYENGDKGKHEVKGKTLFVGADVFVVRDGARVRQVGTLRLSTTRSPRTIDFAVRKGDHEDGTMLGIYELKGDTLRLCLDPEGDSRPKKFAALADTKRFVAVYTRTRPTSEGSNICGKYRSESVGLDGKKMSSEAEILKHGDAYLVKWKVSGGVAYVGTGIRQGDTFSVAWVNRGGAGVSVYRIGLGGVLTGSYTEVGGVGVIGHETLTPAKDAEWIEVRHERPRRGTVGG